MKFFPRFSQLKYFGLAAAFLVSVTLAHAASVTYNLTLTDPTDSTYSGTGLVTFNVAPTQTYTDYSGNVTALSFTINGNTFNLTDATAHLSAFEFASFSPSTTIFDITFSDTVGTSPNRLSLASTAGYVYYYNNLQSAAYGNFGAATIVTPSATPEPSSLVLLGSGILAAAAAARKRLLVS